jgi:hypothetical protein
MFILAFVPLRKGKNCVLIKVTWIYAGCFVLNLREMLLKKVYNIILYKTAKVYNTKVLGCIIWAC